MAVRLPPVTSLPIIAIFGPTGVGKTAVAVAVAERLRGDGEDPVAVSADALQLYAGLGTLTGVEATDRLEQRLVGVVGVTETFSAGRYAELAHAEIDALVAANRRPIVVGGTGLYLRAALAELDLRPPPDPALRARWSAALDARGAEALHGELARRATAAAARIQPTDGVRITRALELLDAGHAPPGGDQLWTTATRHPTRLFALTIERGALYDRIDRRVDAMVAAGAADEVRRADAAGASATARKALGFTQLLEDDIEGMKQATRRYARRQLTWLRKLPAVHRIDVTGRDPADVAADIVAII
ncbi:MAG: tRNA dimethylallyltransferase [Solirubrobacteraceae bacterium]|nr:tRNA dimethylallyltransferase [Solirubrobacteraceae bacterium]